MRKVNLQVIRPWVAKKVVELVGLEDEVLVEYAMGLLEDESQPVNTLPHYLSSTPVLIS
jgi:serine/arginine repetitive matrix protein 1